MDSNGSPAPAHGPAKRRSIDWREPGRTLAPIPASNKGIRADDLVLQLASRIHDRETCREIRDTEAHRRPERRGAEGETRRRTRAEESTANPSGGEPKGKPGDEPERRKANQHVRMRKALTLERRGELEVVDSQDPVRRIGETQPSSLRTASPTQSEPVHTRAEAVRRTITCTGTASRGPI